MLWFQDCQISPLIQVLWTSLGNVHWLSLQTDLATCPTIDSVKNQNPPQDDLRYQDLEMFGGIFLFSNRSFRESKTPFYLVNWDAFAFDVCSYLLFKYTSNIATSCPPPQKKSVKISPSNNLISTFSQGNGSSNHVPLWWYCCLDVAGKCHHGSTFVAISRFGQDWVSDASVRFGWLPPGREPKINQSFCEKPTNSFKKPTPWKGTTPFRLIFSFQRDFCCWNFFRNSQDLWSNVFLTRNKKEKEKWRSLILFKR